MTFDICWTRRLPADNDMDVPKNSSKSDGKSNDCSRNLEKDVENVKADLEKMLEKDREKYDLFVTSYLNSSGEYKQEFSSTHNDTSTFQKILQKIKKFFKFGKNNETDCSLIKREVYANQDDLDYEFSWDDENDLKFSDYDTEIESHKRPIKISASDVVYLKKIIDCFKTDGSARHTNEIGDRISLSKDKDSTKICIVLKKKMENHGGQEMQNPRSHKEENHKNQESHENHGKNQEEKEATENPSKKPDFKDLPEETTTKFSIMKEDPKEHLLVSSENSNRSESQRLNNKLKYMAHLHHDVS